MPQVTSHRLLCANHAEKAYQPSLALSLKHAIKISASSWSVNMFYHVNMACFQECKLNHFCLASVETDNIGFAFDQSQTDLHAHTFMCGSTMCVSMVLPWSVFGCIPDAWSCGRFLWCSSYFNSIQRRTKFVLFNCFSRSNTIECNSCKTAAHTWMVYMLLAVCLVAQVKSKCQCLGA